MIDRYASPQMTAIWSDENRFKLWREVETVVCEVRADRGEIPAEAAKGGAIGKIRTLLLQQGT